MKIKWSVEGAGCQSARCGLKDHVVEIPDEELEGLDFTQREVVIEGYVNDEFNRMVYPYWEMPDGAD